MNQGETAKRSKQNVEYTMATYGRFECKVCGDQGFVPLSTPSQNDGGMAAVELTCSNGHTDSYDPSHIKYAISKPPSALKLRRVAAGVG